VALVLPHSIFFHVGRTAGHSVRKTIREMGIPAYDVGSFHDWPSNIQLNETEQKKLFFCFVRHPLAWLKSFWCHEMQFGWSTCDYSHKTQSDSFAEFLTRAVEAFPNGPASEVFRPFLMQCQEVGRQENLAADLRRILERAGEKVVPEVLEQAGVTTVKIAREIQDAATAPQELLERVLHAERELCERFEYADIPKSLIGPSNVCLATYVPLGESKQPFTTDVQPVRGIENAFSLDGKGFQGPEYRRRTTMAIQRAMEQVDFCDKQVIDVNCSDGVFCFHAESRGAARVVGVDRRLRKVIDRLKSALDSRVDFIENGFYGLDQSTQTGFDVVLCLRFLQMARHPLLLIRTLSRLMKQGGTLVLNTDYLDRYPGVPLMYAPIGSEAPTNSYACTYFNKEGLLNALACYGFHDFVIHAELEQGVDASRDFARMPFQSGAVLHDSESAVGNITLSCRWSPSEADKDPRYSLDGVTSEVLVDTWDRQLPHSGLPEHQASEQTLVHLRDQVFQHMEQVRRLKDDLRTATAAVHDRDKDLENTRRELAERTDRLVAKRQLLAECTDDLIATRQSLTERTDELVTTRQSLVETTDDLVATRQIVVERTDDLVATRHLLIERTERLEKMVAQVEILSRELAEAKARAATAEPTSDSPETTPPTPQSHQPAA
jgi:SAM-dependent methyltransferase